jgi:hypothetical protein
MTSLWIRKGVFGWFFHRSSGIRFEANSTARRSCVATAAVAGNSRRHVRSLVVLDFVTDVRFNTIDPLASGGLVATRLDLLYLEV